MAPPNMKPNSWRKFPRLTFDIAMTAPVLPSVLAQAAIEPLSVATSYVERKRGRNDIREYYILSNLD